MITATPKFIDFDDIDTSLADEARSIIESCLQNSSPSTAPKLVHTCGIPGAGKTTYAQAWLPENPSFTVVQFDDVMNRLSGYQRDRIQIGPVGAFANWELKARAIGYHLFQALIENKRDVFFDHSAASTAHSDLIDRVVAEGYFVEMHYIECTPTEAVERTKRREQIIHRHTPEHLIHDRRALLQQLLPIYQQKVHRFVKIDYCGGSVNSGAKQTPLPPRSVTISVARSAWAISDSISLP